MSTKASKERRKRWYCKHRDERLEYAKRYYQKHREVLIEKIGAWQKNNTDAVRAYHRKHYYMRREASLKQKRERYIELKQQLFEGYGGACSCCGEREIVFLSIDHVNNNGAAHRLPGGHGVGAPFYQYLIDGNFPPEFQILCRNCNWAKYRGGCPHERINDRAQTV